MFEPVHLIQPVGEVAVRMVKIVTKAFDEKTVEGLDKISEMDDFLDKTMRLHQRERAERRRVHILHLGDQVPREGR